MFTFMNTARYGTALQGVLHGQFALQASVGYAKDRLQMRSLKGPVNKELPADPIIVHPDVRRMLLTQKSLVEGGRAFMCELAMYIDLAERSASREQRETHGDLLSFLLPIAKGFLTEVGFESSNLGLQVFGGHGFIREWGMEQNVRDCRIGMIYEGTTGIQGLDLLGRKVMANQGKFLKQFCNLVTAFCEDNAHVAAVSECSEALLSLVSEWHELTEIVTQRTIVDADELGAASVDYLMFSGYVVLAYYWARIAACAETGENAAGLSRECLDGKVETARFYYAKVLPRTRVHKACVTAGASTVMSIDQQSI